MNTTYYTNDLILQVWEKGTVVSGFDPKEFRKDVCGAWMCFSKYGVRADDKGWEIDHVYPKAKMKPEKNADILLNLRPMQWENGVSKKDDFPEYRAVVTAQGTENIREEKLFIVNEETRLSLLKYYE
ncbi:hypothetical protein [uncultured Bacteroides sp.]|uniref:hypothetical protein n=1 Tax=uncultured Bacteroides sp. TaxID=162156 RepID=UPI0023D4F989|nr:hypothetical protein [uncultured Bacteroides sp.]MDE5702281.1 hypothetical protein [Bacteroides sp.]MDE6173820.1 hypothetical protein [Bacteroides sp.]